MSLEMVLNERSLDTLANNIPTAQQWMAQLIDTIRAAQKLGLAGMRTHSDLNSALLAADYSIAQWRNDKNVDRDTQRFFRSLQSKYPFIDILTESDLQNQVDLADFSCNDLSVVGFGIAHLLDTLAVSFPSAALWEQPHLQISYSFLDADEIQTQRIDRPHASHPEHLKIHKAWIENRLCLIPWTPQDNGLPSYSQAGKTPIVDWLSTIKNLQTRSILEARLTQAKNGNLGDYKQLAGYEGLIELRVFVGPGYRIYLGRVSQTQFIVLWGGDKSTQTQDMEKANLYWNDWKKRT
jgi:putative addiction module killer protein